MKHTIIMMGAVAITLIFTPVCYAETPPAAPETLILPTPTMDRVVRLLALDGGLLANGLVQELQSCASLQPGNGVIMDRGQCPVVKKRLMEIEAKGQTKPPDEKKPE